MCKAQLFLIPVLFATGLNGGTLNTVYCYLDSLNGNPAQSQTVTGVSSASCSLTADGGGAASVASSSTDNIGDFSVSAFSDEGNRDATQATGATGTWMVPVTETITWQISFSNDGAPGNESFTGAYIPSFEFGGEFDYTSAFAAGTTITAYAIGDGDGGDGSLTATVISTTPEVPEPSALILVASGALLLFIRSFMKRNPSPR